MQNLKVNNEEIPLESIPTELSFSKLDLQDGDVLLVKTPLLESKEYAEDLAKRISENFIPIVQSLFPNATIIFIDSNVEISKVNAEDAQPLKELFPTDDEQNN